ncbi:hypothetical protein [Mesorhizobium sp.]|uniref:hypothetical protein n=1 Tax=Mesorhizobium sp. TaxID=1871066 RepID=UPI0025E0A10E|nr:hypothetical protein [Mesorhizobium sp.]
MADVISAARWRPLARPTMLHLCARPPKPLNPSAWDFGLTRYTWDERAVHHCLMEMSMGDEFSSGKSYLFAWS